MSNVRMPTSRFDGLWARATNNAGDAADAKALAEEAVRARRVESEQAEQLRQKDEMIGALADVLEAHANRLTTNYASDPCYHEIILSSAERRKMLDVLKKAGRNP